MSEQNLPPNTLRNADGTAYQASADGVVECGEAAAITAFMGWLTSRDEKAGPFSARHEAGQAVELVKKFCNAQGWAIDDARWNEQIRALKQRYPK
jgi:hypothetical protein